MQMKNMIKLIGQISVIITLCFLGGVNAFADDEELRLLQSKLQELKDLNTELDKANMGYTTAQIELDTAKSSLGRLKSRVEVERETLDELRDTEAKFPDIDFSDKINAQRKEWRTANKAYLSEQEYVRVLSEKAAQDKKTYDIAVNKRKGLQRTIDRMSDDLAEKKLNAELAQIRKPQNIRVSAVETCSLSMTKDACMDKARVKAERDAAEQGSLVVVDTVTEVKNFNLTKDEARSRVSARISDIRIIKQTYDLTPDKTGWRVEYEISALVTPAITEQMRQELKQQVISSLGTATTMQTTTPSQRTVTSTPAPAAVVAKPQSDANKEEAVRRQTERELEQLRANATKKAEKKEAKEAEKEMDSRKMTIMVF
jgi:hypothetical protein